MPIIAFFRCELRRPCTAGCDYVLEGVTLDDIDCYGSCTGIPTFGDQEVHGIELVFDLDPFDRSCLNQLPAVFADPFVAYKRESVVFVFSTDLLAIHLVRNEGPGSLQFFQFNFLDGPDAPLESHQRVAEGTNPGSR